MSLRFRVIIQTIYYIVTKCLVVKKKKNHRNSLYATPFAKGKSMHQAPHFKIFGHSSLRIGYP